MTIFESNLIQPDMLANGQSAIDLTSLTPDMLSSSTVFRRNPNIYRIYVANSRGSNDLTPMLGVNFYFRSRDDMYGEVDPHVTIGQKGFISMTDMDKVTTAPKEYVSNWYKGNMPNPREMVDIRLPEWMYRMARSALKKYRAENGMEDV